MRPRDARHCRGDPLPPTRESKPRGRRRPDPLADIFETDVVPILENRPGIRPVGVFEELMRRHPGLGPGVLGNDLSYPAGFHGMTKSRILTVRRCLEVPGVLANAVPRTFRHPFRKMLSENENATKILI